MGTRFKHFMISVFVTSLISGCSSFGDYLAKEYDAAQTRDTPTVALAKEVAMARTAMTHQTNLDTLFGSYGGISAGGCHIVAIRSKSFKRTTNYQVCGTQVSRLNEVTPALPPANAIDAVRNGISQAAWKTGTPQVTMADGYRISATPVGPPDGACRYVEETITYQNQIVSQKTRKICP